MSGTAGDPRSDLHRLNSTTVGPSVPPGLSEQARWRLYEPADLIEATVEACAAESAETPDSEGWALDYGKVELAAANLHRLHVLANPQHPEFASTPNEALTALPHLVPPSGPGPDALNARLSAEREPPDIEAHPKYHVRSGHVFPKDGSACVLCEAEREPATNPASISSTLGVETERGGVET